MNSFSSRSRILLAVVVVCCAALLTWFMHALALVALTVVALAAAVAVGVAEALRRWTRFRPRTARTFALWFTSLSALASLWPLAVLLVQVFAPLRVPVATLTNGTRSVEFHGMIHIGSPAFYADVARDLSRAEREGVPVLHEGVRRSREMDRRRVMALTGSSGDLTTNYRAQAAGCGLVDQADALTDARRKRDAGHPLHRVADVSYGDMVAEWDRLLKRTPEWRRFDVPAHLASGEGPDWNAMLDQLRPVRVPFAATCRAILSLSRGRAGVETTPFAREIIYGLRDRHLARLIHEDSARRLVVLYGAGHLEGTLRALRSFDPAWRVESTRWRSAFSFREIR
ncbi:hypothetical protein [Deinococcus pimensis]|uniref:hypothetical protein n=1 Tax=Deinococcus pimensis TaxID=309888 RepID=UPI000486614F|nr:hypothetical protein [Deinococcus pimensis]